ncbi:Stk1 family PASTA domain-containing Ser/Thr kinase [Natranaerobius thermophilus]|uniref:non-specific serine/threonine protein kinase n=1 Tax=Natranaerobius thermophilus (strain ATCC BAA-1301 / DSM 18059 / JW/NM-WN-LF) TaxID=457570 RepID=B2A2K8_NATTJ|nr:Stk1 family PASTA domain-containing Ser/Thr kinase [Natranaerobius thermophilus]ACB84923.1 serine/threonine protein kinase with PASTA sensor(s) [Natranaerobius thermophilus JW/NM-WN-LF]
MIGELLINRYQIVMHVGTGGMASVYKAKDQILNRYVAIKVLLPQFAHDEEFIKKFRREAQAAASLSHFNVVSIYDVGQDGDRHFIVMEYIEGKSLKEVIIEKAPLPVNKAVDIVCQISDALIHAHANNVVHRDIKPHNILITTEGKAKVTDFGIARAVSEATQTYTSSVMGSAHYFSPEQAKGSYTSERSDIYSVGVVLYEMLTGNVPFNGGSPVSVALKHIQEMPEKPTNYNPDIPQELERVIMRALEKDQAFRYQNVKDLMDDLRNFVDNPTYSSYFNSDFQDDYCLQDKYFKANNHREGVSPEDFPTQEIPVVGQEQSSSTSSDQGTDKVEGNNVNKKKRTKKSRPKISIKKLLLAILILGVIIGGVSWGVNRIMAFLVVPQVTVPNVQEMSLDEAQETLQEEGLDSAVTEREPHPEIEATYVIRQDPEADSTVRQNRTIGLIISEGPELLQVPDVEGMSQREAVIKLEQGGFEVQVEEKYDEVEANKVISQDPSEDTELEEGEQVYITVSLGEEPFVLPDFVGEDFEEIEEEIDDLDLELRNTYEEEDPTLPSEVITRQWPDSGEEVQPGDNVDLWVNKAEEQDEDVERHTIQLENLPTDEEIKIVVDDELGAHVVFEGVPEEDSMEIEGTEQGIVEISTQDEQGEFTQIYDIIIFPE